MACDLWPSLFCIYDGGHFHVSFCGNYYESCVKETQTNGSGFTIHGRSWVWLPEQGSLPTCGDKLTRYSFSYKQVLSSSIVMIFWLIRFHFDIVVVLSGYIWIWGWRLLRVALKQSLCIGFDINSKMRPQYLHCDCCGPFYKHSLTLITAWLWLSNHILSKVWDEITYPFLNFNGWTAEV